MSLIDRKIYMIQTRRKSRGKAERNPRGRADMERCRLIVAFAVLCLCGGAARGEKSNEEVREQHEHSETRLSTSNQPGAIWFGYSTASKTRARTHVCSLRSGGDCRKEGGGGGVRGSCCSIS